MGRSDPDKLFSGKVVRARVYIAKKRDSELRPYSWYKAFVVAGAKAAKLPEPYVAQLESVEAIQDPDRERHERNMVITNAG